MLKCQALPVIKMQKRAVVLFIALSYGGAWALLGPSLSSGAGLADPLDSPAAYIATIGMMFTPAAASIIVTSTVERQRGSVLLAGVGLHGLFTRRSWRFAGWGIAAAGALVVGSWALGLAFGWIELDPERSPAREMIVRLTGEAPPMPMASLAVLQLVNIPIGLIITGIATAGEEIGWRGWLLPRLLPLGTRWALVLSGLIWGLWHAPAILLGLNYEQRNPVGIVMMAVACVGVGILIGQLRLASGSLLPCVLAHAALNVFATYQSVLFPPFDQWLVGPLSVTGWIVMALLLLLLVGTRFFRTRERPDLLPGSR